MKYLVTALLLVSFITGKGQNRVGVHNNLGCYWFVGDHKVNKRFGVHTEYQWRRNNIITSWQQSLMRVGINFHPHDQAMFTLGYGFVETYPYGEQPIASTGSPFPEHRMYEQLQLKNGIGRFEISHRFRMEQRWLGKLQAGTGHEIHGWNYLNRFRYQFRVAFPLKGNTLDNHEFYLVAYEEVFVGFGKNVTNNIFDQNRGYFGLGFKLSKACKFEIAYMSLIIQHGKPDPVSKKPVYEYNNCLQVGVTCNLDFSKKPAAPKPQSPSVTNTP